MILSIIVLLLIGVVAYFHYVQGFFSATISAICAVVAAVLALSLHEMLVRSLLKGKFADTASASMLIVSFAAIYLVQRIIFDKAIPGNLRLPVLLDKVGSGVMGLVAGVFGIGIFAIAAQMMPFGTTVGGYARYAVGDRTEVRVPTARQSVDTYVYDVMKDSKFEPNSQQSLLVPADSVVVNTVARLSDGGALAGENRFETVHPAFLDELFGQRIGIQTGAKHVAYNLANDKQVVVQGLFMLDSAPGADAESSWARKTEEFKLIRSDAANILLVARVQLSRNATDTDQKTRISSGAVRIFSKGKNFNPIGWLDPTEGTVIRMTHLDDYLIVASDGLIDFVFSLPREAVGIGGGGKGAALAMGDEVYFEAKRLGDVDLSKMEIKPNIPPAELGVSRKKDLPKPKVAPGTGATAAAPVAAANAPVEVGDVRVSPELFTQINIGAHEKDARDVTYPSGTASFKDDKFLKLTVEDTQSIALLSRGDIVVKELWAPEGSKIVQIAIIPSSKAPWEWADKLSQFTLVDSAGKSFPPNGAWAKVKKGSTDHMVGRYDAEKPMPEVPQVEGRPTDAWLAFVVPNGTALKELRYQGKSLKAVTQKVE